MYYSRMYENLALNYSARQNGTGENVILETNRIRGNIREKKNRNFFFFFHCKKIKLKLFNFIYEKFQLNYYLIIIDYLIVSNNEVDKN